jgi:hypothetical protein
MMLAMGGEIDVLHQNQIIIALDFLEHGSKDFVSVLIVAGKELLIGLDDTLGRVQKPLTARISPIQRKSVRTASSASSRLGLVAGSSSAFN